MSVQFGTWPPQGKRPGLTPGVRNAYARARVIAEITSVGVVTTDLLGVVSAVAHPATGRYQITCNIDLVAQDVALVTAKQTAVQVLGTAAIVPGSDRVDVSLFRDTGADVDSDFYLVVLG